MLGRPKSLTEKEAKQLQAEHAQLPDVEAARIVDFLGNKHVHVDFADGRIVIINGNGKRTIDK